ncbi:sulfotransferase family protein [Pseudokordiimonas caeni]|uniref:sulfotransferase family protein n=1 Tax=Pseudokordiimonas caeni TaxID=2997908 RepID=UPI00281129A8|nr:sulfotransferase family protein [Pseudokordiimonas caeni]
MTDKVENSLTSGQRKQYSLSIEEMRGMRLEKLFSPRDYNAHISISMKHRYVYFPVAKVATTSLMKALQIYEVGNLPQGLVTQHPRAEYSSWIKPYQLTPDMLDDIFSAPDYFKFTFVRNPYVRLVSAWKDKINGNSKEKSLILKLMGMPPQEIEVPISFGQFVKAIADQPLHKMDRHWRPQALCCMALWVQHDFIGKMENFDADIAHVSERIGFDISATFNNGTQVHRTGASETWRKEYTPELKGIVARLYAEDFARFGYDTEL